MGLLRALGLERYRVSKLKPHLKMAEQRLAILNSKKTNLIKTQKREIAQLLRCLLYTSPSPRDATLSRMPSSA